MQGQEKETRPYSLTLLGNLNGSHKRSKFLKKPTAQAKEEEKVKDGTKAEL